MKTMISMLMLLAGLYLWAQDPCTWPPCPDECPPTDCNCGPWEVRYMFVVLTPPEYPLLNCAGDVRYRIRRCQPPPDQCDGCQIEIDWFWPICAPCNDRRLVMEAIRQEIVRRGLRGSDCQPFGGEAAEQYSFRHPSCWRETTTPPPDLPPFPTGWTLPEVWLVPCETQQYCCFSYTFNLNDPDQQVVPNCRRLEPPVEPHCVIPDPNWDCTIHMCCPPP